MAKLTFKIAHDDTDTYTDIELTGTVPDDGTSLKQLKLFKTFLIAQGFSDRRIAILNDANNIDASTDD